MFTEFLSDVAVAYDALPERWLDLPEDTRGLAVFCWTELGRDSRERAGGIRLLLDVKETDDPEPYGGAGEMLADIADGRFIVSRANSDHPLWTVDTNVSFRIVHDVLGHYGASRALGWPNNDPESSRHTVAGFDWEGENLACAAHGRLLERYSRQALFTECIAQTGYAIVHDGFGPQKVGVPPISGDLRKRWMQMVVNGWEI